MDSTAYVLVCVCVPVCWRCIAHANYAKNLQSCRQCNAAAAMASPSSIVSQSCLHAAAAVLLAVGCNADRCICGL